MRRFGRGCGCAVVGHDYAGFLVVVEINGPGGGRGFGSTSRLVIL